VQPLHGPLVLVVDQAAHREQGRADGDIEVLGENVVGQPGGNGLVGASHLHARLLQQHEDGLLRQLAPTEAARDGVGHVGRDVRERPLLGGAHAHRLLHRIAELQLQRLGHLRGCRDGGHLDHLDRSVQAHGDEVLEQAAQVGALHASGARAFTASWWHRACAAPRIAFDEPFGSQLLECAAHGDARHVELPHQRQFTRKAFRKAAFVQLLAQHQIDLVVFRQRHLRHAVDGFAVSMFCQWDI